MNQIVALPRLVLPTEANALYQLGTQLSTARTIPSVFQKSPADCFNVLAVCMRFGFDFYSTIWECSIIKGRLFFSGKMVHAMLNASGFLAERLDFEYSCEGDDRSVVVRGRIQGENQSRLAHVYVSEVKTGNEHWTKSPDQMLSYAGARIWGRRHLPEVMLGLLFEDEAEAMKDITPTKAVATTPELPAAQLGDTYPPAKATPEYVGTPQQGVSHTTEPEPPATEPFALAEPADPELWRDWAMRFAAYLRDCASLAEVHRWVDLNEITINKMQAANPRLYRRVLEIIEEAKKKHQEGQ